MHRKPTHSIRAIAVGFGLLAALMTVAIVNRMDAAGAQDGRDQASIEGPTEAGTADTESSKAQRHRRKHARDSMALPFVSFAQPLRRGNGG